MDNDERDQMEEHLARAMQYVSKLEAGEERIRAEQGLQKAHGTVAGAPDALYQYVDDGETDNTPDAE